MCCVADRAGPSSGHEKHTYEQRFDYDRESNVDLNLSDQGQSSEEESSIVDHIKCQVKMTEKAR